MQVNGLLGGDFDHHKHFMSSQMGSADLKETQGSFKGYNAGENVDLEAAEDKNAGQGSTEHQKHNIQLHSEA